MQCPRCYGRVEVVETFTDVDEIHRLRRCCACGHKFLTCEEEVPMGRLTEVRRIKMTKLNNRKNDACY